MDFALPEIGEGVYEAELIRWLIQPGEAFKRGQSLLEVMTDKATMEVPSPMAGQVMETLAKPGDRIKVGQPILSYQQGEQQSSTPPITTRAAAGTSGTGTPVGLPTNTLDTPSIVGASVPVKASPSVRQLARKMGIDLARTQGTGPEGRILLEDLSSIAPKSSSNSSTPPPVARTPPGPKPDYGVPGTRVKLVGLRRAIAEHMAHAKRTIPHYSYVEECELTDLIQLREHLREPFAKIGVKLTYLPFFLKAVAVALKEIPLVNSSLDEPTGEIILHDRYHIGIAVATPAGLIVPVVHDVDQKDIATVARDIDRLAIEARTGKIRREDVRGGTFTVTSVGNIGGLFSTPVINHPEVGILGLGKIVKRPVYDPNDQIRPGHFLYLSLSFDHRVVDGAVGAAFTNVIVREMQNPAAFLVPR